MNREFTRMERFVFSPHPDSNRKNGDFMAVCADFAPFKLFY